MTARTLTVALGERSYDVVIGAGSLDRVGEAVARATKASQAALVSVAPVSRRYGARVARSLAAAGLRTHRLLVPDGDASKSLRQATRLFVIEDGRLLEAGTHQELLHKPDGRYRRLHELQLQLA